MAEVPENVLLGFLAFLVETGLLDLETGGVKVAPAKTDDVLADLAQETEFGAEAVGVGAVPMKELGGVTCGDGGGEVIGDAPGSGGGEFGGVCSEIVEGGNRLLVEEPFAIAAGSPLGEVLIGDVAGIEVALENIADLWEGVEPLEEGPSGFAVEEAVIELGADVEREASDFADAGHGREL
jgi:hypothetical protein